MKAIVFGGSGFLGSYVADELTFRGYDVIIFDKVESKYLQKNQTMINGDILNYQTVLNAVQGCDYVYSFAGIAGISDAINKPYDTISVNIMGNTNILEACRLNKVKRFIFASTVYVYSDLAPFYRSSKQACELIIEDYSNAFGLDYTILRYGSLYGKRANHFNFLYNIIYQAIEKGKIIRKGDGEEIREYIHVEDAARSSVDILSSEYRNQYIMLTGAQSIKIKELFYMIKEIFHNKIEIEFTTDAEEGHYEITPYSFRPRIARKVNPIMHYELGQGILDLIYEVYLKSKKNGNALDSIQKIMGYGIKDV